MDWLKCPVCTHPIVVTGRTKVYGIEGDDYQIILTGTCSLCGTPVRKRIN